MQNHTFCRFCRQIIVAMALCLAYSSANALPLEEGSYTLNNHPAGNAATPYYGLRLDGLIGGSSNEVTFDFDDVAHGSLMKMHYTDGNIHIYGNAWGGVDGGSSYVSPKLWAIDFTYNTGVAVNGMGVKVSGPDYSNFGTIGDGTTTYGLTDYSGSHDYNFKLDYDHRGVSGLSGWGWVNYYDLGTDPADSHHEGASDWLFTATKDPTPAPEPNVLALMAIGLLGIGVMRRRGLVD